MRSDKDYKVLERDEYKCYFCGCLTDPTAKIHAKNKSCVVGLFQSKRVHEGNEENNLVTACRVCSRIIPHIDLNAPLPEIRREINVKRLRLGHSYNPAYISGNTTANEVPAISPLKDLEDEKMKPIKLTPEQIYNPDEDEVA